MVSHFIGLHTTCTIWFEQYHSHRHFKLALVALINQQIFGYIFKRQRLLSFVASEHELIEANS